MSDSENIDFARIEIDSPFDENWLAEFISNPQRILRINSLFEFSKFEKVSENTWHMMGTNLLSKQDFDVTFKVKKKSSSTLFHYEGWLKTTTKISIKKDKSGYKLIIIDDYSGINAEEREQRISEVDNTIVHFGNDIHRYLRRWKRWSWVPGWKSYMLKFWQGMKPSARRISFMLFVITAVEFVIFLFVFIIFWLELPKYFE